MSRARPLLLIGAVLVMSVPSGTLAPIGGGPLTSTVGGPPGPFEPALTVAPASWWMVEAANVTLRASWTRIPPGCSVTPEWFRWSVEGVGAQGTLAPDNASEANFTAGGMGTGTTGVVVRSAAAVDCGSNRTAVFRTSVANLTVDAPLVVRNVSISPNPIEPGEAASLVGEIVGGQPPFELRIGWGDGSVGWANVTRPGSFAVERTFEAGVFAPILWVEDGSGFVATATVEEPLNVSLEFAAAIRPSSFVAEVGVPASFSAEYVNPPSGYSSILACGGATSVAPEVQVPSLQIDCSFEEPGTSRVTLESVGADSPYAVASAILSEEVVPPISVALRNANADAEVDLPEYVPVELSGGVPPYDVVWNVVGSRNTEDAVVPNDGTFYAGVRLLDAGADVVSVVVTDALGISAVSASETIDVLAPLSAVVAMASSVGAQGAPVNLTGAVTAGSPPFQWAVVPGIWAPNGTDPAGTLPAIGPFGWNATYRTEGSLSAEAIVVDAAGAVWEGNVSTDLLPPLDAVLRLLPSPPGGFVAEITVSGGAPPFAYWINDSAEDTWNGTTPHDGTIIVRGSPSGSGNFTFELTVEDAWGRWSSAETNAQVPSPPRGDLAAPPGVAVLGVAALALVAVVAGAYWWRHRSSRVPPSAPDAEATLRRIIGPADGADRSVVELVAEEEGVSLPIVRETLDRLIAQGTVRAERGLDGEEVLAWSHDPAP